MGQLNLKSMVRPKRYQSYPGALGKAAPNCLSRDFKSDAPNQKWVTEFIIKGQKVYLSPILDLFNQEIILYEIGLTVPCSARYYEGFKVLAND